MSRRHSAKRLPHSRVSKSSESFRPSQKTMQLCHQVKEALMWSMGSAVGDERLGEYLIDSVEPLAGGNRLLVKVIVPEEVPLEEAQSQLAMAATDLRMEVAQYITRRRAPELL